MYDLGPQLDHTSVDPGTNVLLMGPPLSGKRRLALEILTQGARDGEGSVVVTTRDGSDRVVGDFRTLLDGAEESAFGVVDCVSRHQGRDSTHNEIVKHASSPEDMTGIGIEFSAFLEEFYTERGIQQNRVMLDSLTTLLMYADVQTVFRFVHVFSSRIDNADALGVYVIESTAHDAESLNTLKQLFDGIVEVGEDGELTVRLPGRDAGPVGG